MSIACRFHSHARVSATSTTPREIFNEKKSESFFEKRKEMRMSMMRNEERRKNIRSESLALSLLEIGGMR